MVAAIRTPGAVTLYNFDMAINYESQVGDMRRNEGNVAYLVSSTVITAFETDRELLVVGCATCDSNNGWLRIYNPQSMQLLKGIPGSSNYGYLGK